MAANSRVRHFLRTAATGAIFSGLFAPVVATMYFVIAGSGGCRELTGWGFSYSLIRSFVFFVPMVSMFAVPLGSACGLVGGLWLGLAGQNCQSRLLLTIHGALAGFVLSLLLTLPFWLRHPPDRADLRMTTMYLLTVGSCVGAAGAGLFARLLMKPS